MKLRLIGVATLMAFSGAAQAQSSVTLYGVVDTGLLYQNTSALSFSPKAPDKGSIVAMTNGGIYGSVWGMKGTEDIGNGYHVNFKLQGVFNPSNGKFGLSDTAGVTAIFNQIATVGASGPFGKIDFGRQFAPMAYAMAETDARHGEYFGSVLTGWLGLNSTAGWPGTSTNGPIGALYDSNAIVYESPKFYGVTAALEYAPGGAAGSFQGGTRESAVLKYSSYGLNLSAVYYNGHDTNPLATAAATGVNNNRFWYLGARYTTLNGISMSASYSNGANPAAKTASNPFGGTSLDMYSIGLGYQVTPEVNVSSGLYYLTDRNKSTNNSLEIAGGAEYNLSKATVVYTQVGWVNNHGNMTQAIAYGQPVAPGMGTVAVALGVRHSF